ncbi:MAG: PAS domain S-box protein [Candidatus Pacebacteria bacterium]|nr:PAS domain S-box protein [Candidatus Paceibacterota bacterium]
MLITDTDGTIYYVNAAWQRLTGYPISEVIGKNPRFLHSPRTPRELFSQIWQTLRAGDTVETEELVDRRKDGTEFSARSVYFSVQMTNNATYYVQVLQDISKRKWTEKRKDAFISTASHELRNPLSTIVFSIDLLKKELGIMPGRTAEIVSDLEDETRRLVALLNYLLDTTKIQTGALNIQLKQSDLQQLVRRVSEELQPIFPSHTINLTLGEKPVVAEFDEARIAQVLINLISNAIKYSPRADTITVSLDSQDNEAIVSVQDFGIGIPPEEQQKIFDILYRVKDVSSIRGNGLGLYISSQIVSAHGGNLWVTSEPGIGSTFLLSLPFARSA